MKIVIIGGVAGGATTAARLRRLDEHAEIIIIERTHFVSYANCGLPYYIGRTITDRNKLTLQTPESFHARFNIDVRVEQEAIEIDRARKQVRIHDLRTDETYTETYDKLVLSPGAHPIKPQIPGSNSSRIFTLRTVEDTFSISKFIDDHRPQSATVVGGGFIGLEMAENLVERGISVSVLQRPDHVMSTLDEDMASLLHNRLREEGISIRVNADVTGFEESKDTIGTTFKTKGDETGSSARTIYSDMVVLAIGVTPESSLAEKAQLELGIKGSIKVDKYLRTSDKDIYAIGDAIETIHVVSGLPAHIALAGPANKQGRIVADNIHREALSEEAARKTRRQETRTTLRAFKGSQGSSIMKAFDMTIASTGLNSRTAHAAKMDFDWVILTPASHATYYPGARTMTMKVLFERNTGRILGAQIIGSEGVDKRIDVFALAIKANMTAHDLTEVDLAYAPPYASAKDPVNMAGYVIENILEGTVSQMHWNDALALARTDRSAIIVDVRTQEEFDNGSIKGSLNPVIHIPIDELRERLDELRLRATSISEEPHLLVHCATGVRSYLACRILDQNEFKCSNIAGGYTFYQALELNHNAETENIGDCGLKA